MFYKDLEAQHVGKAIIRNIQKKVNALTYQPKLGKVDHTVSTTTNRYYFLVIKHYKIFYTIKGQAIFIVYVYDTRQNPSSLKIDE